MLLSNEICWQVAKSIVCCDFEKAQRILCGKHESSNDSEEDGHVERVPFTQRKRKFNGATYSRAPVALDIRQDNGEVAYPSCKKSHQQADGKDTLKRPTLRIRAVSLPLPTKGVSPPLQIPPPPPPLLAKDVVTAASTPSLLGKYDTNAESKSDPHNTLASEQELNTESEVQSKSESTEQRYESSAEETETEDEDSIISDFEQNDDDDIDIVVIDDIEEDSPI